ncbi:MAG: pentapeptide repeat-containing protein [Acidobacteriota bacterium]|nr:pentapeptide repeat-containing protein [Acidobacteriota bacterium]
MSVRTPIRRRRPKQGPVVLALFLLTVMVGSYQAPATVPVPQEGRSTQQEPAGESPRFTYRGEQGCADNDGVQGLNPDFRGECGDLRKADLFKTDLQGSNLSGANLSGASLTDVNLQGAKLVGARLIEAILTRTDLREADLTGADLTGAHVSRTQFQGARLNRANLSEAVIRNTDLRGVELDQAQFSRMILFGVNLSGVDLSQRSWEGVEVSSSDLSRAVLTGLNFRNGFSDKVDFMQADLGQADFTKAEVYRGNFIGANLREAKLSQSQLTQANLTGAQLEKADLSQANLTQADLSDASLAQANLNKATLDEALLTGADLQNADLSGASLSGSDLKETDLRGADLTGAVVGDEGRVLATGNPDAPLLRPTEVAGATCDQATQLPDKLLCKKQALEFVASARVVKVSRKRPRRVAAKASDLMKPGTRPTSKNWPLFLKTVRARTFDYERKLPEFVCNQTTRRYRQIGRGGWTQEDFLAHELSYHDKQKHYRNVGASRAAPQTAGEFGPAIAELFSPQSQAILELERLEKISGREVARVRFSVASEHSKRTLRVSDEESVTFGYEGQCWIDLKDFQVVRFRAKDTEIPKDSPIKAYELSIDYKKIGIGKRSYYLPTRMQETVRTSFIGNRNLGLIASEGGPGSPVQSRNFDNISTRFVTLFGKYRDYAQRAKAN